MINMFSNISVVDENIKMFNIKMTNEDKKKILNVFSTIAPLIKENSKNKIVLIKDRDMIQAEALIYKDNEKIKLNAVGFDLLNTFNEITRKISKISEFVHWPNSNFLDTLDSVSAS